MIYPKEFSFLIKVSFALLDQFERVPLSQLSLLERPGNTSCGEGATRLQEHLASERCQG
jgi:hypothetical protein